MAEFIVTLQSGASTKAVAALLQDKGAKVVSQLAELDMLVLETTEDQVASLKSVAGVADVEPSHDVGPAAL